MEKLTGKEIVDIIRAGKTANLASFELGELKIKYKVPAETQPEPEQLGFHYPISSSEEIEQHHKNQSLQSMTQELDDQLLMLTNPQLYEEQLLGDAFDEKT